MNVIAQVGVRKGQRSGRVSHGLESLSLCPEEEQAPPAAAADYILDLLSVFEARTVPSGADPPER